MIFRPYPPKIHKQISVHCKDTTGNRRNTPVNGRNTPVYDRNLSGKIRRLSGWNTASIFRMLFRCFPIGTGRHFLTWGSISKMIFFTSLLEYDGNGNRTVEEKSAMNVLKEKVKTVDVAIGLFFFFCM